MKIKIMSLLICTLFLTIIFPGLTTAKNLVSDETSVTYSNADLRRDQDLIKITEEHPDCDIDNYFVVYAENANLYIYNIKTGETDEVHMGGDINFPKISENKVISYDFSYMGFKMYNIDTGEKTDLIVTNWQGGDTDSFQFSGDYIAYENYDSDLYSTEIYLYDIVTGENIQLTDSPGEDYTENPCIYENIVAWQLNEGNLADIVMYNMDSKKYTRVTNTSPFESETYPSIYDNNIVYSYFYYDKLNGTIIYGLKMYNIDGGDETTIFEGEELSANSPEIFGNIIVYSRNDCLWLFNLSTSYEMPIYESSYLVQPWNLNGNYILFTILNEGVYLYKYNNPPEAPLINGQTNGKVKEQYSYTFIADDPDGDNLFYYIDWGDGSVEDWLGPYPANEQIIVNHSWSVKGTHIIVARAKDMYGAIGDNGTLEVTMPKNKSFIFNFPLMTWLFDSFSQIFLFIRLIHGN